MLGADELTRWLTGRHGLVGAWEELQTVRNREKLISEFSSHTYRDFEERKFVCYTSNSRSASSHLAYFL